MDIAGAKRYLDGQLKQLPDLYCYHNIGHTLEVLRDAEEFGEASKLSSVDLDRLRLAALFHDIGYLVTGDGHEEHSAAIAGRELPAFGGSPADIEVIGQAILATRLPCRPRNLLEQILCDADVGNLGDDRFWRCNQLLRQEWANFGRTFTDREWFQFEVNFLGDFQFHSPVARERRTAKLQQNLAELRQRLEAEG